MTAETIDVPKIGPVKRQYLYVAGAGVAGYVAWRWWQAGSAPPADDSAAGGAGAVESMGTIGADIGSGAGGYYGTPSAASDTVVGTVLATNAEWMQAAVAYLESIGRDSAAAAEALGKYLDHQGLTPTEQSYVRTALGAVGNPPSGTFTLIEAPDTSPSGLGAPGGVRVVAKSATSLGVSWSPVAGASSYRLYRSGVAQNVGTSVDTAGEIGGLTPGTSYGVQVAAANSAGKIGPKSTVVTGRTAAAKLTAPVGLKGTASRGAVMLTWKPVAGADGYRAYRSGAGGNVGSSRDAQMTVGGLKANTAYRFRVRAVAGTTDGPMSGWITVRTKK